MENTETPPGGAGIPPSNLPEAAATAPEMTAHAPAAVAGPYAHLPEDLRAPWTWLDLLIFFFFWLGTEFLAAWILVFVAAGMTVANPGQAPGSGQLATAQIVLTIVFRTLLALYLWLVIRVRFGTPFWRTIGFREFRVGEMSRAGTGLLFVFGGMLLAIVINILSVPVRPSTPLPIERLFQVRETVLLMTFAGIVVAPLVEEIVFRGYIYPVVARTFSMAGGVVVTGALFGFLHGAQLGGQWSLIGLLAIVGIVLTWVRARSGSVLPSYFLHLGYNAILFVAFFFGTGGLRNLPGAE